MPAHLPDISSLGISCSYACALNSTTGVVIVETLAGVSRPGCPDVGESGVRRGVQTLVSPGYVGESGVRRGVRGTKGCPDVGESGVRW